MDLLHTDILIIGSGVAGLYAALQFPRERRVTMLCKREMGLSNSSLAQGGVAAVLDRLNDSPELHYNDTMIAGGQKNNPAAVQVLVNEGPDDVRRLMEWGVDFDKTDTGEPMKTLEGGHSRCRIVHHKDSTGKAIVDALSQRVKAAGNISVREWAMVSQLHRATGGMVADEADLRDFGSRIHREAGRLTSLVNDILTLSNLDEAERTDSENSADVLGSTEPVDVPRMLESISQRLEQVAKKADVTILLETKPAMVVGVPRLLDELAYNLASNAIRYNLPGGSVTLSCGIDEGGHPYIQVIDTGIGIAPEEQDKVFERFYRVDKSRSKVRGGTGLGLAIVKHAAVYHGASIDLASELGMGTCITVTFPVQELPEL